MAAQEASQPLRWRYGGDLEDGNFAVRGVPVLAALLAILVCFVCVCVYLRWACRRYNPDPTLPSSSSSSSSSSASAPGAASSVVGLDAAAVASLPVTLYHRPTPTEGEDVEAAQCSICLGEYADGEQVKTLPRCGHRFHPECVDAWLRSRPSCPLCRGSLLADTTNKTYAGSEAV